MTLVELMVALLLGLVTTYFIAQVFAVAEGQKRTATFGSDAQVNGAVALNTLRRHVLSAGYGVTGCSRASAARSRASTAAAAARRRLRDESGADRDHPQDRGIGTE